MFRIRQIAILLSTIIWIFFCCSTKESDNSFTKESDDSFVFRPANEDFRITLPGNMEVNDLTTLSGSYFPYNSLAEFQSKAPPCIAFIDVSKDRFPFLQISIPANSSIEFIQNHINSFNYGVVPLNINQAHFAEICGNPFLIGEDTVTLKRTNIFAITVHNSKIYRFVFTTTQKSDLENWKNKIYKSINSITFGMKYYNKEFNKQKQLLEEYKHFLK